MVDSFQVCKVFLWRGFGPENRKPLCQVGQLAKGESYFAVPPFSLSGNTGAESLTGHVHVPSAVTGGPVASTCAFLRCAMCARVQGAALGRNSLGGVAVSHLPTALLTRATRPTGFRSTSIFSYYNRYSGICQGGFVNFLTIPTEKLREMPCRVVGRTVLGRFSGGVLAQTLSDCPKNIPQIKKNSPKKCEKTLAFRGKVCYTIIVE